MNKNGRIFRTLKAAKQAFFAPPQYKKEMEKKASEAPVVETKEEHKVLIKEPAVTVMDLKSECCTGCSACFNSCPVDAISIVKDDMGFNCRNVDFDKCINCGKCVKVCPVIETKYKNSEEPGCYAVMADDETRGKSSSGGMFSLAANYILENGGYVCGAAFAEDFTVHHIIISDKNDLYKLRGSKYVQSDIGGILKDIKKLLDSGKSVLFSGCPCQVAGLYGYLDKQYDNLYTMDLVCHGTPPQSAFLKYLEEEYGTENVSEFSFRTKEYGYSCTSQIAYLKDGRKVAGNVAFDPYEKAMHTGLALKEMCTNCPFAPIPRQGDITIGDFWGISKFNTDLNDGLGTSLALVNNEKGKELFDKAKKNAKRVEAVPVDIARNNNRFGRKIRYPARGRRWFYKMVKKQPFAKSVDYAINRKFDVAIMGVWPGCNYGSVATYYALHQLITSFGLSVLMIDKPIIVDKDAEQGMTHSRRFAEEHYDISKKYKLADLKLLNNCVDTFLMGCDQVWNRGISKHFGMSYYFDFVSDTKKKLSYAASFGHSKDFCNANDRLVISSYMSKFDGISVREADGVRICKETYGVEATQVLDPVFVCDKEEFIALTEKSAANQRPDKDEKFITTYILDPTSEKKKAIKWIQENLGYKVINVLDGLPWTFEGNRAKMEGMGEIPENVQVEDWLYYIKNCEYLITDSCHGISFGLIFERPFVGIGNMHRGLSRFESLLGLFNLMDRFVTDAKDIVGNEELLKPVDYEAVGEIMQRERKRSRDWLEKVLFAPKKVNPHCVYATVDERLENK